MSRVALPMFLFLLLTVQFVRAQDEMKTILVKGYIDETTPVELLISVYDQPQEGTLLYQLTKLVTPEDGIFEDAIEVPSEILNRYPQVFVEFAKISSPSEPLSAERMQFTQVRDMSEDDLDNVDDEMMGNEVAEEQAIDEALVDPGLAVEIAEEKMALVDTEAIIDEALVDPGLASPRHASCGTVGPDLDDTVTSDAAFPPAARQRSGSSTDCAILGLLQPTDDAAYFCFTFANDGFTWTYLKNLRTNVHGWTRDDLLRDRGSFYYCD